MLHYYTVARESLCAVRSRRAGKRTSAQGYCTPGSVGGEGYSVSTILHTLAKSADNFACRNYLSSRLDTRAHFALKRHLFSADVAVQTDGVVMTSSSPRSPGVYEHKAEQTEEDEISSLTASDLASILKWSKEISSDINLPMALQRLTEIATGRHKYLDVKINMLTLHSENSGSQYTCVVIAREAGDYTVATSMAPPEACQMHE